MAIRRWVIPVMIMIPHKNHYNRAEPTGDLLLRIISGLPSFKNPRWATVGLRRECIPVVVRVRHVVVVVRVRVRLSLSYTGCGYTAPRRNRTICSFVK